MLYMDYRMKCDAETKKQAGEIERLRAIITGIQYFCEQAKWHASDRALYLHGQDAAFNKVLHHIEFVTALNDKEETASALGRSARIAGPWTDAQLTPSGRWVKAYIQAGYR